VTVNPRLVALPASSVAVQVTAVDPTGKVDPDAGVQEMAGLASAASDADRPEYDTVVPAALVASAVTGPGTERVGAVVSRTVTVKLPVSVFPPASVAVQPTVVAPRGKVDPEARVHETDTEDQSVAVAEKETAAPDGEVASAARLPGTESTGGVVSCTVTVKLCDAVWPASSVAVQVTVVAPIGNVAPGPGEHPTVGDVSTVSDAVGREYPTVAPAAEVAAAV
jgi:hypothetical protein